MITVPKIGGTLLDGLLSPQHVSSGPDARKTPRKTVVCSEVCWLKGFIDTYQNTVHIVTLGGRVSQDNT